MMENALFTCSDCLLIAFEPILHVVVVVVDAKQRTVCGDVMCGCLLAMISTPKKVTFLV